MDRFSPRHGPLAELAWRGHIYQNYLMKSLLITVLYYRWWAGYLFITVNWLALLWAGLLLKFWMNFHNFFRRVELTGSTRNNQLDFGLSWFRFGSRIFHFTFSFLTSRTSFFLGLGDITPCSHQSLDRRYINNVFGKLILRFALSECILHALCFKKLYPFYFCNNLFYPWTNFHNF